MARNILYHISPENFNTFDAGCTGDMCNTASHRIGEPGIYLAPSFGQALKWVGTISIEKGGKSVQRSPKQRRIEREYGEGKRDVGIPFPQEESQARYQTLFLYKVEVPHLVLRKALEHNRQWNASQEFPFHPLGSWAQEIFIPEGLVSEINIVGKKRYKTDELMGMDKQYPVSKGYEDYYRQQFRGKEPKGQVDDYDEVLQARKEFDKNFSPGDMVKINGTPYEIEEYSGRSVKVVNRYNYSREKIDVLDFVQNAVPYSEESRFSWYSGIRRKAMLLRMGIGK